jgi:Protein of unknown function (DUF3761)
MNRYRILALLTMLLALTMTLCPRTARSATLKAAEAKDHIGETATVCGHVVSARYASASRGQPTFLNFDEPYPRQVFTVLIWGNDRAKFGQPEETYRNKDVCATGQIQSYHSGAEIVARSPSELSLKGESKQQESRSKSNAGPTGATAQCRDGSYSYSQHHRGTCSHHGGVARWLD